MNQNKVLEEAVSLPAQFNWKRYRQELYFSMWKYIFMCKKDPVACRLSVRKWHPHSSPQAMEGRQGADTALPEPDLKVSWAVTAPSHRDFTTQNLFWTFSQSSAPHPAGMEIMGCYPAKPLSQPHKHIPALHHGRSLWSFVYYLGSIKIYPKTQLCSKPAVLKTVYTGN